MKKEKNSKTLFIVIPIIIVLAISILWLAASKPRIMELGTLSYEEVCNKNGDQWMVMEPWIKGRSIGSQPCAGCMIADNHFCKADEYIAYMKSLPSVISGQSMMHEMVTEHGDDKNSVDIHMYNVAFLREKLATNSLTFKITDTSASPVSDLEVVHDKIMHLVLVRDDLNYFDHLHPQEISTGVFSVPYEFYAPGKYRVWIDFTIDGMQHIVDFDFNVAKGSGKLLDYQSGNLDIKLNSGNARVDETSKIDFVVNYNNGSPAEIQEKFLAASAHLIVIDDDLGEFGHTHDEEFDGDNVLSFSYKFVKSGRHKIWLQFSLDKITRTAELEVDVSE